VSNCHGRFTASDSELNYTAKPTRSIVDQIAPSLSRNYEYEKSTCNFYMTHAMCRPMNGSCVVRMQGMSLTIRLPRYVERKEIECARLEKGVAAQSAGAFSVAPARGNERCGEECE
jgi:hypothetical protein